MSPSDFGVLENVQAITQQLCCSSS